MDGSMITGAVIFVLGMVVGAIWNATAWRRYHSEEIGRLWRRHQQHALIKQLGGRQFTLDGKLVHINDFIEANNLSETELDQIGAMSVKDEKTFQSGSTARSVLKRII